MDQPRQQRHDKKKQKMFSALSTDLESGRAEQARKEEEEEAEEDLADEEEQTKRKRLRDGGSTARRQRQARELRVSNEVPNKGDLETQVPGIL